jgi:hypothetical protein
MTHGLGAPERMTTERARNLARIYKGLADELRRERYDREAALAEQDALWWVNYAITFGPAPARVVSDEEHLRLSAEDHHY